MVNPPVFYVRSHSYSTYLGLGVLGGVPCDLPREVVRDALAMSLGARSSASFSGMVDNRCERPVHHDWPLVSIAQTNAEDVETPLAIDFSFLQSSNDSFLVEYVWDGENVNSGNVSKWVASKLKSIATTIGVALSGYESEVIHLLSRIEKKGVVPKQSVQRTPSTIRRQ